MARLLGKLSEVEDNREFPTGQRNYDEDFPRDEWIDFLIMGIIFISLIIYLIST